MSGALYPAEAPALYIHVPYCSKKCGYCSFHSLPLEENPGRPTTFMVEATLARARTLACTFNAAQFSTAYVGGGTPTALPHSDLRTLLAGIRRLGGNPGFREWTVEANPESLGVETLRLLADAGVDRISLGVQSLETSALEAAGRGARPDQIEKALVLLSSAWKGRFSADLMVGLPGQSPEGLRSDIARLVSYGAEHLSVYELILEEGTPLDDAVRNGSVLLPDEEKAQDLWAAAKEGCCAAGLKRYEVSNWAFPGAECLHNRIYWKNGAWIGAGPSAVSSFPLSDGGSLRVEETRDHDAFIRDAGASAREERIPADTAVFETVMMAFRTRDGLDDRAFRNRFGKKVEEYLPDSLAKWKDFLVPGPWGPAPTDRLLDILNRFLMDCMKELERTAPGSPLSSGGLV